MIDKLGYVCEVDVIDSLPGVSGKPDRGDEERNDFWNILASEMNETEPSVVNSENAQVSEPASRGQLTAAEQERASSPISDTREAEERAEPLADQNAVERLDQADNGEAKGRQPDEEGHVSLADVSREQTVHPGPSGQMICQDTGISQLVASITDSLGENPDQEDDTNKTRTGEPTVEGFGLELTSVPVTSQVITLGVDNGTNVDEEAVIADMSEDQPGKRSNTGDLRRQATNTRSQLAGPISERQPKESITTPQESTPQDGIIAKGSDPTAVTPGGPEHPRTLSNDRTQQKKETGRVQGGTSAPATGVDNGGVNDLSEVRSPVSEGKDSVTLGQEIVEKSSDNPLRSSHGPKQDSHVALPHADSAGPEQPRSEQSADVTSARRTSPLPEQAEHLVTIQRVAQAIRLAHERHGEIRLRLYPPELGALKIQMRVHDGALTARLEVETPTARDVLLDNLPGLRERLADHQIRVESFDVALMNDGFGGQANAWDDSSGPQQAFRPHGTASGTGTSDANAEPPKTAMRRAENGQFDVIV